MLEDATVIIIRWHATVCVGTRRDPLQLTFVATVSTAGRDKVVIVIPKDLHGRVKPVMRKPVRVTIEEIPVS